jgi:hypothetical protein
MKSIELTEEHKSKLLEMCKILFPKIKWQHYDIANENNINKLYPELWVVQNNSEIIPVYIHWFEFCLTHLVNKINYPDNKVNNNTLITPTDILYDKKHPVDFLYEEFKKLK